MITDSNGDGTVFAADPLRHLLVYVRQQTGDRPWPVAQSLALNGVGQRIQQETHLFNRGCHQYHALLHGPLLELKDVFDRLPVPGIAPQSPHRFRGIGDYPACQYRLAGKSQLKKTRRRCIRHQISAPSCRTMNKVPTGALITTRAGMGEALKLQDQ